MKHGSFVNGFTRLAGLAVAALLSGCFDTKQEFTLNPDGSGKVVHECVFQITDIFAPNDTSPEGTKDTIRKVIEKSVGVDAWRDVSYRRLDDGRLFFRGTAYFPDLTRLDIPNQTMNKFAWRKLAGGNVVLELRPGTNTAKNLEAPKTNLPPADLAAKLAEERAKYQQMKPMLSGILAGMKQETVLHLPGRVSRSSNFEQDPAGTLRIRFEGARLLAGIEKVMTDDEWVRKRLASGTSITSAPPPEESFNALLYGQNAPVQAALVGAHQPLFDYATELAAAQKEFAKVQRELGNGLIPTALPAQGGQLKSVKVAGARLISGSDIPRGLRPFNSDAGYTLAVLAELPGSVLEVSNDIRLETAIADDGTSLLPGLRRTPRFNFPKLSPEKTAVLFEVELAPPGPRVRGLRELSGRLRYSVASGSKEMELGFTELKAGADGAALGARIKSIEPGSRKDGSRQIQLKLNLRPENLRAAWLVLDGVRSALARRGYSGGGNSYEFTFEAGRAVPERGDIVVEVFDQIQSYDAPYKLENISLLGNSAADGK